MRAPFALLPALVALAACVSPALPAFANTPAPADLPYEVPFFIGDCKSAEFVFKVAPEKVRPLVPEEFEIVVSGATANAGLGATVVLGVADCPTARLGERQGTAAFYWTDIGVEPLEERLKDEGIATYLWRVENFVEEGLYAEAMRAGRAQLTLVDKAEVNLDLLTATFDVEGHGADHHGAGPLGQLDAVGAVNVPFREYGAAEGGGFSYVEATWTSGQPYAQVAGVFTAPDGSVAAQIVGATVTGGLYQFGGGWTFGPASAMGWVP